ALAGGDAAALVVEAVAVSARARLAVRQRERKANTQQIDGFRAMTHVFHCRPSNKENKFNSIIHLERLPQSEMEAYQSSKLSGHTKPQDVVLVKHFQQD